MKTFLINFKTLRGLIDFVEIQAQSEKMARAKFKFLYPLATITSIEEVKE
jgi:hypothetical protein